MPMPWWTPPPRRPGGGWGQADESSGVAFHDPWTMAHLSGYGSVDAPSPWGYNRDVFESTHPSGSYGYYDPMTGGYTSPHEVGFSAPGPYGPEAIGTGSRDWGGTGFGGYVPQAFEGASMPGAAGYASYGPSPAPEGSSMPISSGGDTTPVAPSTSGDSMPDSGAPQGFDMGTWLEALSGMDASSYGSSDHDSSASG